MALLGGACSRHASARGSLGHYRDHAAYVEEIAETDKDAYLFVGVERQGDEWPSLVISQTFTPSVGGSSPGVQVIPETHRVFVGAGTRLLCYRGDDGPWTRQWQDTAESGFWGWRLHDDIVVMSAELARRLDELRRQTLDHLR